MNLIASWYFRICELRNALAGGEAATLVPDFLSVLYLRAREFHKGFAKGRTMTEYALILSAVAVVVFARLCCSS
jgi:hypothetical protein